MSWSGITATDTPDRIEEALKASAETYKANLASQDYVLDPAAVEQIDGAIAAALVAIPVVAPDQLVQITLNGHANPGHMPNESWSNDFISMSITNMTPREAAAA